MPHPRPVRYRRLALAVLALGAIPALAACGGDGSTTLTVRQEPPSINVLDYVETTGVDATQGDFLPFAAEITVRGGPRGRLIGLLSVLDVPVERRIGSEVFDERIGTLIFDLGRGDQLMALGGTVYPVGEAEMARDAPQVRAIIGGTGTYRGAAGEVTTTRNGDGSYTHRIELSD